MYDKKLITSHGFSVQLEVIIAIEIFSFFKLSDKSNILKDFSNTTPEEKRDFSRWVQSGHSSYENGDYVATESGGSMDFINARRSMEQEYQEYLKDPEAYRGSPEPAESISGNSESDNGLPF